MALKDASRQVTSRLLTEWSSTEGKRLQIMLAGCVGLLTKASFLKLWKCDIHSWNYISMWMRKTFLGTVLSHLDRASSILRQMCGVFFAHFRNPRYFLLDSELPMIGRCACIPNYNRIVLNSKNQWVSHFERQNAPQRQNKTLDAASHKAQLFGQHKHFSIRESTGCGLPGHLCMFYCKRRTLVLHPRPNRAWWWTLCMWEHLALCTRKDRFQNQQEQGAKTHFPYGDRPANRQLTNL